MMHDFVVTKRHVIFPFFPVLADLARLESGGPHWRWEAGKGSHVGIMPRDGSVKDMRWFHGPDRSFFHFMNGHSKGDQVHIDFGVSAEVPFPFIREASGLNGPPDMSTSGLVRWTFDLAGRSEQWEQRPLGPPGDFPIIARRDHMDEYAIGYYQMYDPRWLRRSLRGRSVSGSTQWRASTRRQVSCAHSRPVPPTPCRNTCTSRHRSRAMRVTPHSSWISTKR